MAVAITPKGRVINITGASADVAVLDWTTMQSSVAPSPGVYRINVNAITILASAAGTATTIKNGGSGGVVWYSLAPAAAGTTLIAFSEPQVLDDIAITFGTNITSVNLLIT
jgi:N-methylhydantoinase A/oxoprolinase/acetone carboxylase beta subunit